MGGVQLLSAACKLDKPSRHVSTAACIEQKRPSRQRCPAHREEARVGCVANGDRGDRHALGHLRRAWGEQVHTQSLNWKLATGCLAVNAGYRGQTAAQLPGTPGLADLHNAEQRIQAVQVCARGLHRHTNDLWGGAGSVCCSGKEIKATAAFVDVVRQAQRKQPLLLQRAPRLTGSGVMLATMPGRCAAPPAPAEQRTEHGEGNFSDPTATARQLIVVWKPPCSCPALLTRNDGLDAALMRRACILKHALRCPAGRGGALGHHVNATGSAPSKAGSVDTRRYPLSL